MSRKIFSRKPYRTETVNGWTFEWCFNEKDIQKCYLKINNQSENFGVKIAGSSPVYAYLLAAAEQGRTDQLEGYAVLLYMAANILTQDQMFADGVRREIDDWSDRLQSRGMEAAMEVTEESEEIDEAWMRDVARYADASPSARERMREEWKKEMKDGLGN